MQRFIDFFLFLIGIRRKKRNTENNFHPTVSILIPAYNEEDTIKDTLLSVLTQSYQVDEVIVIDDCSTDRTGEIAKSLGVKVVRLSKNSGTKSKAQNYGLQFVRTDLVVTIDADTMLDNKAIEFIISAMDEKDVLSACGFVIPQKITTFWEKCRLIQYLYYISLNKSAQSHWQVPLVSSGCFSIFDTKLLKKMGGFPEGTIVEDMALTWKALIAKKKIKFISKAICFPKDPSNWQQYKAQVMRWNRGFLQCIKEYKISLIKNPRLSLFVVWYLLSGFAQPLFLGFFVWYIYWFFSTSAYLGGMFFILLFSGLLLEMFIVLCFIILAGIRYKHFRIALSSFPYYWLIGPIDAYLFINSVIQEWVLGKKLETWEKGH